jgi:predicted RNase H-like nuclease
MATILGIDAAWTERNPSGVALIASGPAGWRLLRVAASYSGFVAGVGETRPTGRVAPVQGLLEVSKRRAGEPVAVVAVDMPIANKLITGRRAADDKISRGFGAMKCAAHSPTSDRPGRLSLDFTDAFARQGYNIAFEKPVTERSLVEVYPHPALVRLCGEQERLKYKQSRIRSYWPDLTGRAERRAELMKVWKTIVAALDHHVQDTAEALVLPTQDSPAWALKAFEEMLDAVVCAWIGGCVLDKTAEVYGDGVESAIWVPEKLSSRKSS